MGSKGQQRAFRPLFEIPKQYVIPRNGAELVEIAEQYFDPASQRLAVEVARANENSELRSLPTVGTNFCGRSLQTPEFAEILSRSSSNAIPYSRRSEFSIGQSILLLEKQVAQKQIIRERSLGAIASDHPSLKRATIARQLEYILAAEREYDFLETRVLLEIDDQTELKGRTGYAIMKHNNSPVTTFAIQEQAKPYTEPVIVDPRYLHQAEDYVQKAFDLALSPEDSRAWMRETAAAWKE